MCVECVWVVCCMGCTCGLCVLCVLRVWCVMHLFVCVVCVFVCVCYVMCACCALCVLCFVRVVCCAGLAGKYSRCDKKYHPTIPHVMRALSKFKSYYRKKLIFQNLPKPLMHTQLKKGPTFEIWARDVFRSSDRKQHFFFLLVYIEFPTNNKIPKSISEFPKPLFFVTFFANAFPVFGKETVSFGLCRQEIVFFGGCHSPWGNWTKLIMKKLQHRRQKIRCLIPS